MISISSDIEFAVKSLAEAAHAYTAVSAEADVAREALRGDPTKEARKIFESKLALVSKTHLRKNELESKLLELIEQSAK